MSTIRCATDECPTPAAIARPVPLCRTHQLEVAICVLADRWATAPAADWPDRLSQHEARKMLLDLIQGFAEQGPRVIAPRDFTPYLADLTRSRPWVVAELQRLAAEGAIEQTPTCGEYLLDGTGRLTDAQSPEDD